MRSDAGSHSRCGLPSRTRYRFARRILAVSVFAIAAWYVGSAFSNNWDEVKALKGTLKHGWLALHLALVVAYFAVQPFVWNAVIRSCGARAPIRSVVISAYLPCLGKYVPGKIWTVVSRAYFLAEDGRTAKSTAAKATGLQYIMEVLGATPYLLVLAWLAPISGMQYSKVVVIGVALLFVVFLPPLIQKGVSRLLVLTKKTWVSNHAALYVSPGLVVAFVAHWSLYAASGVAICLSFETNNPSDHLAIGCAFVASWLIGFLSLLTPGGIGVREGVMVVLLSPLIGPVRAAVVPLIARISWTIAEAIGVAAALAVMGVGSGVARDEYDGGKPQVPRQSPNGTASDVTG